MGEKNRVLQFGSQARMNPQPLRPGQQIQIDLKNAKGAKIARPVQPSLLLEVVCLECRKVL